VFEQLLFADQLRGTDGTGIFYNTKKGKGSIKSLKAPIKSAIFCDTMQFGEAKKTLFRESSFAIGHNRSASKGKVSMENTHPFREEHITLVHNGTLLSHKEMKDVEVDSHAICHSIASEGAIDTLKILDGAFALVWFDNKEKTLNLCRNSQRPLNIIECDTCFIIVSEMELGLWIAERNKLKVVQKEVVETRKLYKFNLEDMKKFTKEDVTFKEFTQTNYGNNYGYGGEGSWKQGHWISNTIGKGNNIRFRGGELLYTDKDKRVAYVEGDVLKWKTILPEYVRDDCFEDEWRIKIFGTKEYLQKFIENKNLIGKISHITYRGNVDIYTVINVEEYKPSSVFPGTEEKETAKVLQLPNKDKKKQVCECCNKEFEGQATFLYDMWCCPQCTAEWAPYAGQQFYPC
jgi:predicted glutamine amidotransferase